MTTWSRAALFVQVVLMGGCPLSPGPCALPMELFAAHKLTPVTPPSPFCSPPPGPLIVQARRGGGGGRLEAPGFDSWEALRICGEKSVLAPTVANS